MVQLDLLGAPITRKGSYFVVHDESVPSKRWFLVGLLFVADGRLDEVRNVLRYHRDQEGYRGEIHFSKLPGSFRGEWGADARLAKRWLLAYEQGLHEILLSTVLAVDRHSRAFDPRRFFREFHTYNRFTAMALKSGIAWHLGHLGFDSVEVTVISDTKDRPSRPDQGLVDNFVDYIPYRAELDSWMARNLESKRYPEVHMQPVRLVDSGEDDVLQLTDLILGATQEAMEAKSQRHVKRTLGLMVRRWYWDLSSPPWHQKLGMHRRVSLWGFPDADGCPFNRVPFKIEDENTILLL